MYADRKETSKTDVLITVHCRINDDFTMYDERSSSNLTVFVHDVNPETGNDTIRHFNYTSSNERHHPVPEINETLLEKIINDRVLIEMPSTATTSVTFNVTAVNVILTADGGNVSTNFSSDPIEDQPQYNWYFLLLLVFVFTGGLGNILVCLSICLEKKLQNVTNYFLMSLAVADLLVSMVVMPFGISSGLYRREWQHGTSLCNVYVTFDVLCCSSSILHMTFISIGRYMGIRNPLKCRYQNSSKKVVLGKVVLVWMFAMAITSPITVLGIRDKNVIQPNDTSCSINSNFFWIFGSLGAFYIPMVIMVSTYVLTVKLLQKQAKFGLDDQIARRLVVKKSVSNKTDVSSVSSRNAKLGSDEDISSDDRSNGIKRSTSVKDNRIILRYDTQIKLTEGSLRNKRETQTIPVDNEQRSTTRTRTRSMKLFSRPGMRRNSFNSNSNTFIQHVETEQKASKVLGLVFFAFVIFWAPFFIMNILFPVLSPQYFSPTIIDTCLWLGYISSTINPIIYTVFNKSFRHAFLRLLMCRCRRYAYRHRHRTKCPNRSTNIVDRLSRSSERKNETQPLSTRSTMSTLMIHSPTATFQNSGQGKESRC